MFGFLLKLIRWKEWGHSKIPLLFVAGNTWILLQEPPVGMALARFGAWLLFSVLYLAYGYAFNDFCDSAADRRAGKTNLLGNLPRTTGIVWLLVLVMLSLITLAPFYRERWLVMLVIASYTLATTYSMPPLRFKERGVVGLLASAIAQRSLPLLVGMAIFSNFWADAWVLVSLSVFIGLRWILVHQVIDLPKDEQAEVNTFARYHGSSRALALMKFIIFPLEIVLLLIWVKIVSVQVFIVWLLLPSYGAWFFLNYLVWKRIRPVFNWHGYWHFPLSDLYEIVWPLFLCAILTSRDPRFAWLLLFQLIWQFPVLRQQFKELYLVVQIKLRTGVKF